MKFNFQTMRKIFTMAVVIPALVMFVACGPDTPVGPEPGGEDGPSTGGDDNKQEQYEDIKVVNGKVRFYLSEKENSTRTATNMTARDWAKSHVQMGGKNYPVQLTDEETPRPYIEVPEASSYSGSLLTSASSKWYGGSTYADVKLTHSQFYHTAISSIKSFPMYGSYSKETGNKLVFNDGFAMIYVRLKGAAQIVSVKVENPNGKAISGIANYLPSSGKYTVQKGFDFAVLNCTNEGKNVQLTSSKNTNFRVMIAPGNYPDGLKVSICDAERGAMFVTTEPLTLAAGDVYTIEKDYACENDLVFYEGFDNFVWGGDIMKGSEGFGFAPTADAVTVDSGKELTGYEDAFAEVAYDNPGTGFIQSNTWDDVTGKTVGKSHQMSESYVKSRNIGDYRYMFRCQERPGYVVIGDGNGGRGIAHTLVSKKMVGIGDIKVTIRFAVEANFTGSLLINVCEGGVIKSAKMNGVALDATAISQKYSSAAAAINVPQKYFSVSKSAAAVKEWNTLEMEISGATDGTCYYIADNSTDSGQHGIYVDYIEARQVADWDDVKNLRVLYWNIQNGMIADQHNNYDNFVKWVKDWDPDVCIWCESESIYKDKSGTGSSSKYLPDGWAQLCTRYGHSYAAVGGNRDNYPQTITSKFPIKTIKKITNTDDGGKYGASYVSHGAGHFQIDIHGKTINFVTLHMWPQAYSPTASGSAAQETSKAAYEGYYFREYEMQYIVKNTINHSSNAGEEYWIFGGDTNSNSRLDDWSTKYSTSAPHRLITHDVVLNNTNLKDVIASRDCYGEKNNVMFRSRIDILYASPKMFDMITNSIMLMDDWTGPLPAWEYFTSFHDPSDHTPVLVDFNIK